MAGPSSASALPHKTTFAPRPFPPPALAGVPLEYIIDSLHKLAPRYWNHLETSDCSIIFPVHPISAGKLTQDPNIRLYEPFNEIATNSYDPAGLGRRVTAPTLNMEPPRVLMRLHIDYLSAQSTLLRGLFSGASPLDLINTTRPLVARPNGSGPPDLRTRTPTNPLQTIPRPPRLLPSPPHHPMIFLPVPDPTSFHYLVTWMYFGRTDEIEKALHQKKIFWAGVASNVEYLGMPMAIKAFLGTYYQRWLQPGTARPIPTIVDTKVVEEEEEEEESEDDDVLMEEDEEEEEESEEEKEEEIQPARGRSRDRQSASPTGRVVAPVSS